MKIAVLLWGLKKARTKDYKVYDNILLRYEAAAEPLAEELYKRMIMEKWHVTSRYATTPNMQRDFFIESDATQRSFINKSEIEYYNSLNGSVFLTAPSSLTHLQDVDPSKIGEVAKARKELREIMEDRENRGQFGWTLCTVPTEELASHAGISFEDYKEQIIKACYLDKDDPVAEWDRIFAESMEIKKWLNGLNIERIRLESKSMDLEVLLGEKRNFIGVSGHNIPSFEIFTSPDWRGTKGYYFANLPSYRDGNLVENIKVEFEKGRVIRSSATKGEEYVQKILKMDEGASQVGEFSLTDIRFSRIDRFMADTLFDENYGGEFGNSHIALGNSYLDTFAGDPAELSKSEKKNLGYNESALHWDIVNTEDKVATAILKNGEKKVIYEKGQFTF